MATVTSWTKASPVCYGRSDSFAPAQLKSDDFGELCARPSPLVNRTSLRGRHRLLRRQVARRRRCQTRWARHVGFCETPRVDAYEWHYDELRYPPGVTQSHTTSTIPVRYRTSGSRDCRPQTWSLLQTPERCRLSCAVSWRHRSGDPGALVSIRLGSSSNHFGGVARRPRQSRPSLSATNHARPTQAKDRAVPTRDVDILYTRCPR